MFCRLPGLALLVLTLGACGSDPPPTPPPSDVTDPVDDAAQDGGDAEPADAALPDTDADPPDAPPEDVEPADVADTDPADTDPADTDPADTDDDALADTTPADTEDTPDGDDTADTATDTAADADPLAACLRACGIGCPAPVYQPCASDGQRYCSVCVLECYGLTGVDPGGCAPTDDLCPAPEGTRTELSAWEPPEGCALDWMREPPAEDITSDEALLGWVSCADELESGVDWDTHRLVAFVLYDNPDGELAGVWRADDGAWVGLMRAPAYCGGAPPPTAWALVQVPSDGNEVRTETCVYGVCVGPPRP